MKTSRFTALAALLAVLALWAPATFAEVIETDAAIVMVDPTDQSSSPPFAPARIDAAFAAEAPEGVPAAPEGVEGAMYAAIEFAGSPLAAVIGKTAADVDGFDVLYVDMNRDGAFGGDEKRTMVPTTRPIRGGGSITMGNSLDVKVAHGEGTMPFVFAWNIRGGALTAQFIALWYMNGNVTVGEKTYRVAVRDGNADGDFDDEDDHWLLREEKPGQRGVSAYALSATDEKRFLDGNLFSISLDDGKLSVTVEASEGPDPVSQASHRTRVEHMWFERFEAEKEGMIERFGMDTTRPLAEDPIQWNYVTFDEAKAMSAAAGKPLFLDVMAYWCVWCYRMDFYTYPDAEVADILNEKFIPVKIIQEEDLVGDYSRIMGILGARGIPAMGIWDAEGELLKYISGFSKPVEFVTKLLTAIGEGADEESEEPGEE